MLWIDLRAAFVLLVGMTLLWLLQLLVNRSQRGSFDRIKITREQRERFYADLHEHEAKLMKDGPTIPLRDSRR